VFFDSCLEILKLKYEVTRHIFQAKVLMMRPKVVVLTVMIEGNFYYNELIFAKQKTFLRTRFRWMLTANCFSIKV
jgi:hypothetical protein